jgi:putative transposase
MRKARIKITNHTAVYHCISRIVGGEYLLDDPAKETFRIFMWQQADFAGLQVLTYCLMTNHTHILVRVPLPGEVSDAELVDRVEALYGADAPETVHLRRELEQLKQRFSRWYNEVHDRYGSNSAVTSGRNGKPVRASCGTCRLWSCGRCGI